MFIKVIRLFVYAALPYTFISCNTGKAKQPAIAKQDTFSVKRDTAAADIEVFAIDSNFQNFPLDFINDSAINRYPATILTTGTFHEDEVGKEDAGRNWYGLFLNSDGYYIDSTSITTRRVQDPIDEDGQITGWEVKTTNKDTSLLLIAGVNGLEKRQIKKIALGKNEILPGESVTYSYNGITYILYATGNKQKERPDSDYYMVSNYRLFIRAIINGSERTSMLVSSRAFDDAMVELLFAGDIDGDNIPDLIINTSYHYNATVPTLYLSKPAGDKEILKPMGWHVSVGC
jgi:hypothetical protein